VNNIKIKKTNSAEETIHLGHQVGLLLKPEMTILLAGDLAAGKTTLTKGIGLALGIKAVINSPSFTILKRYLEDEVKLYHLDLYRLDDEGMDFDLEDYINSDGITVIEWPFNVKSLLPKEYLLIEIEIISENKRNFTFKAKGRKYQEVVDYL
jgi:tRNA threonylcarbamoyladenosine biosynthesis protein TsaE